MIQGIPKITHQAWDLNELKPQSFQPLLVPTLRHIALPKGYEGLPDFINPSSFYQTLKTSDGEIRIGNIHLLNDTAFHLRFIDGEGSYAGHMNLHYQLVDGAYQGSGHLEMALRGEAYGFELVVQQLRHDHANPQVGSYFLRAVKVGRRVWLRFDGFVITNDSLDELKTMLLHYKINIDWITDGMSPLQFSNYQTEINPTLFKLSQKAHGPLKRTPEQLMEATKNPGKLALMAIKDWDAVLDLTNKTSAFDRFEQSAKQFWILRGEPERYRPKSLIKIARPQIRPFPHGIWSRFHT